MRLMFDGFEVDVPAGITVKEAAKVAGIKIPGLCDYPDLKPYGGCRLCLVEIEGVRGYPSSCTMSASEGMIVKTDTPSLRDLRMCILEMLLSEHPCICISCERSGKCDEVRKAMRKVPQTMGCRYCPKDQRCELQDTIELVGLKKIELPHISSNKEIVRSPFFDRDSNLCILCGRCIRACEDRGLGVIAFTLRGFETRIGTAFEKPLEEEGCRFCGACVDVCPTGALMERGGRWAGVPEQIVVTTCPYCSANCQIGLEVGNGRLLRARPAASNKLCVRGRFGLEFVQRDRLKRPLIRRNGKLVEASWDEALEFAAEGMARFSGRDFALLTSGVLTNEALYLARKFAKEGIKGQAVAPDVSSTGWRLEDLTGGPLLIIGDLAETNPAMELALRSSGPVVVSPLKTMLAKAASVWLCPKPGHEVRVLTSLTMALGGKVSDEYAAADVIAEEINRAAERLKGAAITVGPDCSPEEIKAANNLALTAGGRLCLLSRNCNSRGVSALGLNLAYHDTMQALKAGGLKAVYIVGSNPVRAAQELKATLSRLEFLVVQDLFVTETARLADVVLPAASFAEINGTFTGSDGGLLQVRQAIPPIGRPDWQILAEIGRRIGVQRYEFSGPEEVLKEMQSSVGAALPSLTFEILDRDKPSEDSFLLIRGPSLFEFGSGTRASRVSDLRYLTRDKVAEINPEDAREMSISQGDTFGIESGAEKIKAKAKISSRVPPRVLHIAGTQSNVSSARVRQDV